MNVFKNIFKKKNRLLKNLPNSDKNILELAKQNKLTYLGINYSLDGGGGYVINIDGEYTLTKSDEYILRYVKKVRQLLSTIKADTLM